MTNELNQAISNVRRYMDAALSVGHTASQYRLTDGSMSFLFHGDLDVILAALSAPPADDVREAAQTFAEHVGWNWDALDSMWRERFEQAARRVLVRPRGTVTGAEVEAAAERLWRSEYGYLDEWAAAPGTLRRHFRADARAALEAAREARS